MDSLTAGRAQALFYYLRVKFGYVPFAALPIYNIKFIVFAIDNEAVFCYNIIVPKEKYFAGGKKK